MSETIHVVCPGCNSVNRIPREKLGAGGKCGSCKSVLLDGKPLEVDTARFNQHLGRSGLPLLVDFWAAWCGPCISSFPYLQKFWEQHKDDPDVIVLAVNTWERIVGQERIDNARKFFTDNGYTMPLLLDMNDKMVADYGVEGIPTKFFVGPDGKICFKDVGFHGPSMVDDMNIELEMIRDRFK